MEKQQIEWVGIDAVRPYENNPRINDDAVDAVASSIREFGFQSPIIVDRDMVIIAGHTRLKAAKRLGLDTVPVIVARNLTDEQARAYRLADNKTGELAEWDYDLLDVELDGILDIDMTEFGFEDGSIDFSNLEDMMGEKDGGYLQFEEKFKPKHTTDDCFTPPEIYDVVKDWVLENYGDKWTGIERPFYPGGDFTEYKYPKGCLVLDNPPFSIQAKILDFYNAKGIDYFLFANGLTTFALLRSRPRTNTVLTGYSIEYENGAVVNTSFLTNLGTARIRTAPDLRERMKAAQDDGESLPNYVYPPNITSAALLSKDLTLGVELSISADECRFIDGIEAQPKGIFGGGGQ